MNAARSNVKPGRTGKPSAPETPVSAAPTTEAKAEKPAAPVFEPVDLTTLPKHEFQGKEFLDMRGLSGTMATHKAKATEPHKYVKVHADAEAAGSPCKLKWKNATKILIAGRAADRAPNTAKGIIQVILREAGEEGISGMELVPLVRAKGKHLTRSDFATGSVPPIGWAEGWIDGAIKDGIAKVHPTKVLTLTQQAEAKAEAKADTAKVEKGAEPRPAKEAAAA